MKATCIILAATWIFISCSADHNQLGGKAPYYDGRDNFIEPNPHDKK